MITEPSNGFTLYVLFLFFTCIVGVVKLLKTWGVAPPFKLSAKRDSSTYAQQLEGTASSLRQWIGFTLLVCGMFAAVSLFDVSCRALDEKVVGYATFLFVLVDYSTALAMALFAILLLYVIRWHMLKRIEYLRN